MATDYTGIDNHNEYYTNHYFYNLFESDVKAKIKELTPKPCADGVLAKAPWTKLRGYARLFFEALDRAKKNEDPNDNLKLVEDLAIKYLDALGYPKRNPISVEIDKDMFAPVFLHSGEKSGDNLVWIILSTYDIFPKSIGKDNGQDKEQNNGENSDHYRKLSKEEDILNKCAFNLETSKEKTLEDDQGSFASITDFSNHELISKALFKLKLKNPPRFIMLIGLNQIILVDRNRWNSKRYLSFNLEDIFLLKDTNTLEAMTVLLYRDSLSPQDAESALDEFHDKSYRNALEVSEGLKYSLRECVELLGNEIIHYWNSVSAKDQDKITIDSKELSIECLRYMYRILFVLFIEADPKLRYAPMKEQSYASSYSFESLRDIADNVNAETVDLSKSYFIFESLTLLFNLIYNGYPFNEEDLQRLEEKKESLYGVFKIEALKAHIFDPERTPLITGAKLRDSVMIRIVRLMSISRPKEKKGSRPGRISYSTLGVNQLGAVYENLLSFSGFIAKETLFEVKVKDAPYNELDVGYFVTTKDLNEYSESERVYVTDKTNGKQLKKYEKGQFIFRIAGREKENSASYYTPESLTKCLVKYALKELLDDKTAEDILKIKVIEPAMGSAAFLNETINQLAESYIVKKREELGEKEDFNFSYDDLQSVKMFIADRNVYGIDLNPVAVELAEVSLWLNTIHTGGIVPWFGTQLVCGNSLLGARRECYDISQLKAGNWYDNVPKRIAPGEKRKEKHEIYHFLLGDPAMSLYKNKVVKELEKDKIKFMHDWQKEFTKPLMDDEIQTALFLSVVIDELWENQAQLRKKLEQDTLDPLSFFGHVEDHSGPRLSIRKKDEILTKIYKSEEEKNAGSYARLKFAMDYWCALWFWPIEKAELLPSRSTFLLEMSYILKGTMESVDKTSYILGPDGSMRRTLFPSVKEELVQVYTDLLNGLGVVDLPKLCLLFERLSIVRDISEKYHFLHWELEFADIFKEKGGFDLCIGNPPWVKLGFNEALVLADRHPVFAVKKLSAIQTMNRLLDTLQNAKTKALFESEYQTVTGMQNFFNAYQNYPLLKGQQTDLYKCFLPQTWKFGSTKGVSALIHPGSVFNDPKGGALRKEIYRRLLLRFGFKNEKLLFSDVANVKTFYLNIYRNKIDSTIDFKNIENLYDPTTIDECFNENIKGPVPQIKDKTGNWNLKGHPKRIIDIQEKELKLFAKLLDSSENFKEARLPILHSKELLPILDILANQPKTIESLGDNIFYTEMFHETKAQKSGIIKKNIHIPNSQLDSILSGPNIGLANPLFQASRKRHATHFDYDNTDLTAIPEDYLTRVVYSPLSDERNYLSAIPVLKSGIKYNAEYRIVMRRMFQPGNERSLFPAIIAKGIGHIHPIFGFTAKENLALIAASFSSIVYDFLIRTSGKFDIYFDILKHLPLLVDQRFFNLLSLRALLLNCLNIYYSELWSDEFKLEFSSDNWAKHDPRLSIEHFQNLKKEWAWDTPLRTDYSRRQALIEIDVLTAMSLGLSVEQLKSIYRFNFQVLHSNEDNTFYDAQGRIVFTTNGSLKNVGFSRSEFDEIKDKKSGVFLRTFIDETLSDTPLERVIEYFAPFDKCDREKDYETAWSYFSKLPALK